MYSYPRYFEPQLLINDQIKYQTLQRMKECVSKVIKMCMQGSLAVKHKINKPKKVFNILAYILIPY